MADLEIDNQHDFFKTVKLDSNGSIKVWIKTKYPSFDTLTFLLSMTTLEFGLVLPIIKDPCINFPLNSNENKS